MPKADKKESQDKVVKAVYTRDSKRYHVFEISNGSVAGSIYFPKGVEVPDTIMLHPITEADPEYKALHGELMKRKER